VETLPRNGLARKQASLVVDGVSLSIGTAVSREKDLLLQHAVMLFNYLLSKKRKF
jgi:hypothetical protein